MIRECPSCKTGMDENVSVCPGCARQFTRPTDGITRSRAGRGVVGPVVRGIVRPKWVCSRACQLVVVVRDKSGSMKGQKARDASEASQALVGELAQPSNKDGFFVGVADFADVAEIVHPPARATALHGNIKRLAPSFFGGWTNITEGMVKASELITGFTAPSEVTALRPVVLLFTDGCHNVGPGPEQVASSVATVADIVTVAYGDDANEQLLRQLATTPQHFYRCSDGARLRQFMAQAGATMSATMARGTNATQALGAVPVTP